jgi:hypothetical protein
MQGLNGKIENSPTIFRPLSAPRVLGQTPEPRLQALARTRQPAGDLRVPLPVAAHEGSGLNGGCGSLR